MYENMTMPWREHPELDEMFAEGKQFPPAHEVERLAKYKRLRKVFDGKQWEIYERATEILKDTPHADQLRKLYIAANIIDPIVKTPADMLVGEKPTFDSGEPADSASHKSVMNIVDSNSLVKLTHESVIGNGIRGDSWIKARYGYREDFSELREYGLIDGEAPEWAEMEPIIEHVSAANVFPETKQGDVKSFKAVNVAWVEWVLDKREEIPFLNVERHYPGYVIHERYRLYPLSVDERFGPQIDTFTIGKRVSTGRETDVVETGAKQRSIFHIPHDSLDDQWYGQGTVEKVESLLAAINDRLVQIDYILWKHSDPAMYGPPTGNDDTTKAGGSYHEVEKDDVIPGYLTWNSQLDGAFKQLDYLLGKVYQITETPDWMLGTSVVGGGTGNSAGGTSHTTNAAIRSRFLPVTKKVKRIRTSVDKALRDAIYVSQQIENYANEGVKGFESYDPVYPTIKWKDGVPRDEKEDAEVSEIRTGGKPTVDQKTSIRRQDDLDDKQAQKILDAIEDDDEREAGPAVSDPEMFREGGDVDGEADEPVSES
ncbi:portal protein [Salibacterium aidingense]|uniref:portal protein n=1 Tax=Salibacterium aidingense TaxID=384933 RepID=UPI003BC04191